jgi:hypothetical protein
VCRTDRLGKLMAAQFVKKFSAFLWTLCIHYFGLQSKEIVQHFKTCYTAATESLALFLYLPQFVILLQQTSLYASLAISYSVCSSAGSDSQVIMMFSSHKCFAVFM